jgi:hypothetical protein
VFALSDFAQAVVAGTVGSVVGAVVGIVGSLIAARRGARWAGQTTRELHRLERQDNALEDFLGSILVFERAIAVFKDEIRELGPAVFETEPDRYGDAPPGPKARERFQDAYRDFQFQWDRRVRPFIVAESPFSDIKSELIKLELNVASEQLAHIGSDEFRDPETYRGTIEGFARSLESLRISVERALWS